MRRGPEIPASRNQQDSTVRLSFEPPLAKGQPATITFYYDGKLTGQEESPVYGVKFAAIHPDFAYLMYPARWFPVAGYTTDRFAADFRITVPDGYKVMASGFDSPPQSGNGKTTVEFKFDHRFVSRQHRGGEGRPRQSPIRRLRHVALFPRTRS